MITEFDEDFFTRFVDRVIVYSRTEIGFDMKCDHHLSEIIMSIPRCRVSAPIATKITVNPLTNPNAPNKVFFVVRCPPPAK